MPQYLITGGAGFIGSHLAESLLHKGHNVVSIDNFDPFYAKEIKEKNLEQIKKTASLCGLDFHDIRGDIRDSDTLDSLFQKYKIDGIFHLAAKAGVRPSIDDPVSYWDVNCKGAACVLESARKAGVSQVVFASSSSVYGNCKTAPFSEDMFVGEPISAYAATKRADELLCYNFSHLYNMHTICIRYFTVYGPRQRPDLAIHKFSKLIAKGCPIPFYGDGSSERDYTFVTDIVAGTIRAMTYAEKCPYDIINLGESNTISLSGLVGLIEKELGKKAVLDKKPFQPGDVQRTWADITKAKKLLGYKPGVTKEQGIKKFIAWIKEQEKA
ncbi:MAG: GDP-mannose 4,6-dehydratase [Fibrobacteria bacterium]|nr:GDP-mannose 4,6-dehydratase [Fibrobacteria bacterium]